jgi:predicted outer membrane repeat protein
MSYVKRFILAAGFFLSAAVFASASGIPQVPSTLPHSYYVSAEGNDVNNGLSEKDAFKTLSKAVTFASAGSVRRIVILGTLDDTSEANNDIDSVFVINNSGIDEITICGKDDTAPGKLLGGNGKRVIFITGKSRIRFENIFISGGETEEEGGGIFAVDRADITLGKNTVISGNFSSEGGGIFVGNGTLTMLQNAIIRDNSAATDEGGGAVLYFSYFTMGDEAEISGNSSGGVILVSCVGVMRGDAIIGSNQCKFDGGGIMLADTNFTMSGYSQVNMNKAGRDGGGICAIESDIIIAEHASINNNEADKQGGGIYLSECSLIVRGEAIINNNTGLVDGGGIYATKSYLILDDYAILGNNNSECGGGFCIEHYSSAIVRGEVTVIGNKSWGPQGGGGLCAGMFSNIHMSGGLVTKNSSSHGGGVYVEGATFTLSGGEITNNTADLGGGVYGALGSVIIQDDSLVNNNKPDNVVR